MKMQNNKNKTFRNLATYLLIGCVTPTSVWSSGKGSYSYGEDFDRESNFSRGMSDVVKKGPKKTSRAVPAAASIPDEDGYDDSVSTLEYGMERDLPSLLDNAVLSPYVKRLYLEITPSNCVELHGYATSMMHKGLFNRFDGGVFIKRERSGEFSDEVFFPLLTSLKSIKKFKISIGRELNSEEIDFIADSFQRFKSLEEIDLSGCGLTDESLDAIVESTASRQLVRLDIRRNRLTSAIISKIRRKFKTLEDLEYDVTESEARYPVKTGVTSLNPIRHDFTTSPVKSADSDRIAEELRTERLKRELAEQRAAEVEKQRIEEAKRHADEMKRQTAEAARLAAEQKSREESVRLETQRKAREEAEAKRISDISSSGSVVSVVASTASSSAVSRPVASPRLAVPAIARGYEAIYARFMGGKLIYRPEGGQAVELPFSSFVNPNTLEGTFDLSRCGDAGQYLSISTGYKKGNIAANASKSEVWISPKFLVQRGIVTSPGIFRNRISGPAAHFQGILSDWNENTAPFALFYTWGGHDNLEWYDYLTTRTPEQINTANLYENYMHTFMYQYNNITTEHRTLSSILINF